MIEFPIASVVKIAGCRVWLYLCYNKDYEIICCVTIMCFKLKNTFPNKSVEANTVTMYSFTNISVRNDIITRLVS